MRSIINRKNSMPVVIFIFCLALSSCGTSSEKKTLEFTDFPGMKIGFSTQNFQKAMPNNVANLSELIEYAANEGYHFIELRDELARLSVDECKSLAEVAKKNNVEVIYEIQVNLLDNGFPGVFTKGLENTVILPGPGVMRTLISRSEFEADPSKKGWSKEEFTKLTNFADSCSSVAREKKVLFIVENVNEAFFGDGINYFGLADFFSSTTITGLQFDTGNPFAGTIRVMSDPGEVSGFLTKLGNRWVTSQLKTIIETGGTMQPTLTENPLPVEKVINLMGQQNVNYVAIELLAPEDKEQCFENHAKSIQFLKDKGVLKK